VKTDFGSVVPDSSVARRYLLQDVRQKHQVVAGPHISHFATTAVMIFISTTSLNMAVH